MIMLNTGEMLASRCFSRKLSERLQQEVAYKLPQLLVLVYSRARARACVCVCVFSSTVYQEPMGLIFNTL